MDTDVPRLKSLDSLRGIAALIVVLHHCIQYTPALEKSSLLHRLAPGGGAVLIFFVLSGLVLSMTYVYRDGDRFLPFLTKRFFRIWPTFAVAILLSAALRWWIGDGPVPGAAITFAGNWAGPFTTRTVLSHLAMTGRDTGLDPPIWSLVQEMRISSVFPLLVLLVRRSWPLTLCATVAACLAVAAANHRSAILDLIAPSVRFIPLFIMGAILALKVRELRHAVGSASRPVRVGLWLACLFGVAMSADYSGFYLGVIGSVRLMIHGLAAAGVVMLCASGGRVEHWLTTHPPLFFGRISYSLYLIHVVTMTAVIQAFHTLLPVPLLIVAGVVLALGVATLMERFIERPSAHLGRWLAQRIDPRPARPQLVR